MRYIDLPFHRMDPNGSRFTTGFVSSASPGSAPAAASVTEKGKRAGSAHAHGVPGFSAADEDESESGVFSDKDFRNMSLKVWTKYCVVFRLGFEGGRMGGGALTR